MHGAGGWRQAARGRAVAKFRRGLEGRDTLLIPGPGVLVPHTWFRSGDLVHDEGPRSGA